ncbi:hypothetical protein SDC9_63009 [bioreactor metagenome]|uniref:Uncharacterized protein n=1 Tax=bioreactor metagenome TaxID=1076179 RepID=A0A644XLK6_9ZZZZ
MVGPGHVPIVPGAVSAAVDVVPDAGHAFEPAVLPQRAAVGAHPVVRCEGHPALGGVGSAVDDVEHLETTPGQVGLRGEVIRPGPRGPGAGHVCQVAPGVRAVARPHQGFRGLGRSAAVMTRAAALRVRTTALAGAEVGGHDTPSQAVTRLVPGRTAGHEEARPEGRRGFDQKRTRPEEVRSGESGQCGVVVRLGGDLGDQLGVQHGAVGVDHDDGPGQQPLHAAVGELDAEGGAEVGAERGAGHDVVEALGAAEAARRERQVGGRADHDGVLEAGGQLVEPAHRRGAHRGVDAGEDVEDDALAAEGLGGQLGQVRPGEAGGGCLAPDDGELPHRVDRGALECSGCHAL